MIKCPKCGEDNQLGAIFCRGCGVKLEIDDLRPDDFQDKSGQASGLKTAMAIIRNLLLLVLVVGSIGVVVAMFVQPSFVPPGELNEEGAKAAKAKFVKFRKGKSGTDQSFTTAEINMLAKLVLQLTPEEKDAARQKRIESGETPVIIYDDLAIELLPPADVKVVLKVLVYDKIPLYAMLTGTVSANASGLGFTPSAIVIGRLPIPPIPKLRDPILGNLAKIVTGNENFKQEIQSKIKAVVLAQDNVTIKK